MSKRFTIGFKISISLTIIILITIGSHYFIYTTERQGIKKAFLSDLILINNAQKKVVENELSTIKNRAADFSSDGYIRDATKELIATKDTQVASLLNNHLITNKQSLDASILGINIINNAGEVIASTHREEIGRNEIADGYFPTSEDLTYGDIYVSDLMRTNHIKENTISLIVAGPLTDKATGMRIGALINIVDVEKTALSPKNNPELFKNVTGTYKSIRSYILTQAGLVFERSIETNKMTLNKEVTAVANCEGIRAYQSNKGVPVIGIATCLDNNWTFVTEIDEQETLLPLIALRRNLLLLIGVLLLVVGFIIYILNRRIIKPIQYLSSSAEKIGKGNFAIRTNIKSPDEIGDLSAEFDTMAQKLQESHINLAQKIREVTKNFEKFKLAVEGASDHVIIANTEGVIIYANKAATEMTGYSQEEILGNRPSLWGKQMPEEFYQHMWRVIKEEKRPFHGELTNKRKSGDSYIADIHISPLFDENNKLYGFVGIERDITKQKEIERSKTEFVSIASHQLRTPLTIINWYVEMLSTSGDQQLSPKQLQYLNEITHASKRMIELVNSLLNVSRIDMGTFMVEPEAVNFAEVIEEILKDLAPQIANKKISIIKRFDNNSSSINADPKLIRMVFQNLLTNAIKYTLEGGVVTIGIEQRINDILITVADTGMGIPHQQQSKIFQKFFRADNARMKEPDGNGLGLYITKSIIENAGGTLWFVSEENRGTTFYIALPLTGMQKREGTRVLAL